MSALNLYEAYTQVYDDSTLEFDDILTDEDLEIIEELDDETLEELVDEVISDLIIDEECEIEEIEGIFEEVLSEARIDMAARAKARKEYAKSSEADAKSARKAGDAVVRKEKRAAAINRVKRAVESGVKRAKSAVKSGVDSAKEAGRSAKFHGVDKHVASYANKRGLHPAPGMAARSKDPAKRRALRSKVAGDLADRAYSAVRSGANTVKSSVKGAAKKVAHKAAVHTTVAAANLANRAGKFAKRMAEDVDLYDVVLEYLLDEGYAETEEAANVIMVNMSEEWREDILDEANFPVTGNFLHPGERGRKKIRGKKQLDEPGKNRYASMQHNKKQAQRERDSDEQRRRDRAAMSRGTWDKD